MHNMVQDYSILLIHSHKCRQSIIFHTEIQKKFRIKIIDISLYFDGSRVNSISKSTFNRIYNHTYLYTSLPYTFVFEFISLVSYQFRNGFFFFILIFFFFVFIFVFFLFVFLPIQMG